ncbi:OB-fold domain-containing protein [Streptomyces sp. GQFP]|uniref:OB-fold domain-containing protein n=1 Tax=Streptomyces sp. GQFP TaxID=2907545 RepID=UPI001F42079E|nr:OB-fold domain-containing protein [Streptomyces sp. GQFP]UIX29361.1 OB-fold domain-containing protein [Streptomyces sp. GQFP]
MTGLLAYGAYVPYHRLLRRDLGAALGSRAGKGSRAVASYDEDTTSMAVEAARNALHSVRVRPQRLYLATSAPPYLDKTNAAAVHAALGLDRSTLAVDMGGAPRSAIGALLAAADAPVPTLALLSDIRTGLPGSGDERDGGDAAAALLFGPGGPGAPVLAEVVGSASTTEEFLERWRLPGAPASRTWEDRFGGHVYGPLTEDAFAAALKAAGLTPEQVDHLVVCGSASRPNAAFARGSGVRTGAVAPSLTDSVGNPGTAQPGLLLADVLDRAVPGQYVVLVQLADGATAIVLRTTEHIGTTRPRVSVTGQVTGGSPGLGYHLFLTWRGLLDREPPRRPEPDAPAAPPSHRASGYKYAFEATRCEACGTVNLPPSRVCYSCSAVDRMAGHPMRDALGTVATFTVDRLAFTPSPPMVAVVVDFDGGGRFRCELADAGPDEVTIGMRVELTFRRLLTADGVHNYFWKARPVRTRTNGEVET